jgi:hypothetical protein
MSFTRDGASDEAWRRALELPRILGVTWAQAGSHVKGTVQKWMKSLP